MKNLERRFINSQKIEIRAEGDSNMLDCLAIPFETLSEDLGGFKETIKKGAFSRSLIQNPDVRVLWNHDTNEPIGRAGKNATFEETEQGVRCRVKLPRTTRAMDIMELVKAGIVTGMSFGFVCNMDEWEDDVEGMALRKVVDGTLFEVSPVTFSAYSDSVVALRSKESTSEAMESLKKYKASKEIRMADYFATLDRQYSLTKT